MKQKPIKIKIASEVTGLSVPYIYYLARRGRIPAYKTGKNSSPWLFRYGELFRWYIIRFHRMGNEKLKILSIKHGRYAQGLGKERLPDSNLSPERAIS